mmetsp:Transcript_72087/g.118643  ORF Transcript_72087/g.118643 Transcript_72087/m.118643 type:complete len:277 (+) Transcript_72087:32-862(+)
MLRHRSLFWVLGGMALNVALRPSPPGYAGYARARPAVSTPAAPYKMTPAAKPQPKTPMPVFVGSLEDWLRPEATSYQALHFPRSPSWPNYQMEIDRSLADFGPECQLERTIERQPGKDLGFKQAAEDLLRGIRLPEELLDVLRLDAEQLGKTLAMLCPWNKIFLLKLEIMGEHNCPRWHRDSYIGRGIISYNLSGTQYIAEEHVNIWELENCGNNDHILRDPSKVREIAVGDLFFIKGNGFPTGEKGLVHKSPPVQFHPDGFVKNRLVLKVDVPLQ